MGTPHPRRRLLLGVAATIITGSIARAAPAGLDQPCVPPLVPSEASCTFDIYGYVTDANGEPFPGVHVSDGDRSTTSDSRGFYDLFELQMGTYFLTFAAPTGACYSGTHVVVTTYRTLIEGGTRHDAQLPCAAR